MQPNPSEGGGTLHSTGQAPTTRADARRRPLLDIRMFPHIIDMVLSYCDTATLARMRLSRRLYRHITPMLAHLVPGCDGDDCGGLANGDGGCAYWKWKEREPVEPAACWTGQIHETVTIVQVLRPKMCADRKRYPLYGLPSGIERCDTLVLPVNTRTVKDMHFVDFRRPARLVWYPTDTHPSAKYRASEIVINYKHWIGPPNTSGISNSLNELATSLRDAFGARTAIILVAPPDGVYEYINEFINEPGSIGEIWNEDIFLVYPEHAIPPAEPVRCLTVEEYADEIGPLVEVIESSIPPEGLGWRTFRVTAKLGEPSTHAIEPRWDVRKTQSGMNPRRAAKSGASAAATPAWIPHRSSSFRRPQLPRSRSL